MLDEDGITGEVAMDDGGLTGVEEAGGHRAALSTLPYAARSRTARQRTYLRADRICVHQRFQAYGREQSCVRQCRTPLSPHSWEPGPPAALQGPQLEDEPRAVPAAASFPVLVQQTPSKLRTSVLRSSVADAALQGTKSHGSVDTRIAEGAKARRAHGVRAHGLYQQ